MASIFRIIYIKWRFRIKRWFAPMIQPEFEHFRGKKKCLVMLAADYGNLGDVAITYAQEQWLKEHYPDHEIIDVPISETLSHLKSLQHICTHEDIITVVGGGNMSDLYYDIELLRQMVVKAFPANRVILFPQTMFFSDTLGGKYMRHKAQRIYSRHKNLTITARERWSYMAMKVMISKSILVPDIVMTLDKRAPETPRDGVTLCLRNDAESGLSQDFKEELKADVSNSYVVVDYDTHIGRGGLSIEEREKELNKIWAQFRSSQWVITDRLHGMIFAFITCTPCLVLPNNNFKIEGCYSWIKDCGYIHFFDEMNISQIIALLQSDERNRDFEGVHDSIIARAEEIIRI